MTKREAMRLTMQNDNLRRLGFSSEECDQLRRISLTLHHWAERECNEDIKTRADGSAWVTPHWGVGPGKPYRIPNREAGALRRLDAIMATRKRTLTYYHQTDPRGAALYIVPLAKYREHKRRNAKPGRILSDNGTEYGLDCCYSQVGIAVY